MMTYREHYEAFVKRYDLSEEGVSYLLDAGAKVFDGCGAELAALIEKFYQGNFNVPAVEADRRALAEKAGIPYFTLNFVFFASASLGMKEIYREKGISDEVYDDTFGDLIVKAKECRTVHGYWGIFPDTWYTIFFRLELFRLGRLEFGYTTMPGGLSYDKCGVHVEPGEKLITIHIPSGLPLTRGSRLDSYRRAYEFFPEMRKGGRLVIACGSWLLYPDNRKIFPPHLNLVDFIGDFDILRSSVDPKFNNCWRLFGRDYDGHPENLPRETTQQRAMADWLMKGGETGSGFGLIVFDGEKIVRP